MKICEHCEIEHPNKGKACRICKDGLYRYNMTRNDMLELYEEQGRVCRLCDKDIKMFNGHEGGFIDHCHETDTIRGILCNRCNTIVGSLETHKDIPRIIDYIGV